MSVKNIKCNNIKNSEWISSSFADSFGSLMADDHRDSRDCKVDNDDIFKPPSDKKAKYECYYEKGKSDNDAEIECVKVAVNRSKLGLKENNHLALWCDKYKPQSVDDLVINKKKINELEDWLRNVWNVNNKNNKILLITGPTGCGKVCTLSIVCKKLNISILEWITPIDITYESDNFDNNRIYYRSVSQIFNEFILRSTKYSSLLTTTTSSNGCNKKIIVIKDLPNTFIDKPEILHDIIKKYYNNLITSNIGSDNYINISPIVFINSCNDIVRELFPDDIKYQYNITNINFNPVTKNNIIKALNRISLLESKLNKSVTNLNTKDVFEDISESSEGDLRSALLKLQFNGIGSSINGDSDIFFKIPKPVSTKSSNSKQRIKVKKLPSSKHNKTIEHKICEIDKDKKINFFNSIGRVLYPKKEFLDNISNDVQPSSSNINNNNYKFIYSPDMMVDNFLTEPNKFVNLLHENYLERFTKIKDVCKAANHLSFSDILLSANWENKEIMVKYSLSSAVYGLMTTNTSPAPNSWKPMAKSRIWVTENNRKQNLDNLRQLFPDLQWEKDFLLDVIPYLKKLKLNLNDEQNTVVSKISHYKI